jgi:hypothetical protein
MQNKFTSTVRKVGAQFMIALPAELAERFAFKSDEPIALDARRDEIGIWSASVSKQENPPFFLLSHVHEQDGVTLVVMPPRLVEAYILKAHQVVKIIARKDEIAIRPPRGLPSHLQEREARMLHWHPPGLYDDEPPMVISRKKSP